MAEKSPDRKTQIVHYLINQKNSCSITELMKLAYLLDVGFKKVKGEVFTGFDFKRYLYGPFTKEIYKIVGELMTKEYIALDESLALDGKSVFRVRKGMTYSFDQEELTLMNKLLKELISLSASELTHISYNTEPMRALKATLGGEEGMNQHLKMNLVTFLK